MTSQLVLFDYEQLDTETRITLKQRADRINERTRRMAQDIWENGREFHEAQQELAKHGYGCFVAWAESETGYSIRTVYNVISVYQNFDYANFAQSKIATSALYLLAAPSTPDEARTEAIERAQAGETITYTQAKEIVAEHKTTDTRADYNGNWRTVESTTPLIPLDIALDDQLKPVCQECGQVYDGANCPDCYQSEFNYKRDARHSVAADIYTPLGMDACQTPPYALDPLLPYLKNGWHIWEPACGEGLLEGALYDSGFSVAASDILREQNFFEYEPDCWDCLVTNPPYSIHFQWLERCYQLGKPFALLLKVEILGTKTAQDLFNEFGIEVIFVSPRINNNIRD